MTGSKPAPGRASRTPPRDASATVSGSLSPGAQHRLEDAGRVHDERAGGAAAGQHAGIGDRSADTPAIDERPAGEDRDIAGEAAGESERAAGHPGAAGIAVVAGEDQRAAAVLGQPARSGDVVAPSIEGVEAALGGIHGHRHVLEQGAVAVGGGEEIEAGPAAAVVQRPARGQLGGREHVAALIVGEIGKARGEQHLGPVGHHRRQIRRPH
jgi:hypothetical protein